MNSSKLLHLKATCLSSDIASLQNLPYRTLLVPLHLSVYQMAVAVLNSFDFDNENFFALYLEMDEEARPKFEKSSDRLPVSRHKDVKKNLVDKLFKVPGDIWYMLFDMEDRWWFSIELIEVSNMMPVGKYPRVIDSMFDNPVQYPLIGDESVHYPASRKKEAKSEIGNWFTDVHNDELSALFTKMLADAIDTLNSIEDGNENHSERPGKDFSLTNLVDLYFSVRERLIDNSSSNFVGRAKLIIENWNTGIIDLKMPAFRVLTANDKAELLLGKAYLSHYIAMKDLAEQAFRAAPENIPNLLLLSLLNESQEKIKVLRKVERLIVLKLEFNPDAEPGDNKDIYDEPLFFDLLDVWRSLSVALCEDGQYQKAVVPALSLLRWTDEESEPAHELLLPLLYLHLRDFKHFQPWFDHLRESNKNGAAYHWILYEMLTGASEEAIEKTIGRALKANAEIAVYLVTDTDDEPANDDQEEAVEYYNACIDVWNNYPELLEMIGNSLADFRG